GCAVIELYGLTEGFMTTLQPEEAEGRLSSVGKPVRGNDYILVDEEDGPLGWGETGEICVRSVHWMSEYHNRPDATKEAEYIDPDGVQWMRTGDIGRTDKDGFLYITDRKKDMIISGGQNIYPVDIEAIMADHPLVSEVAVIGVPDEKWGETPLALVVPRGEAEGGSALGEELLAWTNARVGKRQKIKQVLIRSDLPRNPNGKVLKRALRA
ncbi:MAG: AMP-binding protein, partial [Paracoccaceae bacterium]